MKEADLQNTDGFGYYAWNKKENKAEIEKFYHKGMDAKIDELTTYWNEHRDNYSFIITHSRYGTSGGKSLDQCHPIPVDHLDMNGNNEYKGWYIIHNGVLDNFGQHISDTQLYAKEFGQWMHDRNIQSLDEITRCKEYVRYLSDDMFKWNRVVIIHKDKYIVINRDTGIEGKYGDWHSGRNATYKYANCSSYPYDDDYTWNCASLDDDERYDLKREETLCSIWNRGTSKEFGYVYNNKTGKSYKVKPKETPNELDYIPDRNYGR